MNPDLALRQRIEARLDQPRQQFVPRPAFDASVRQADMGAGSYQVGEPRRGVIGFVLLHRIDVTDKYPVTTAICGGALVVILMCVMRGWGLI